MHLSRFFRKKSKQILKFKKIEIFRPLLELLEDRVTPSAGGGFNQPPVSMDWAVTTLEDTPYPFQLADFNFDDPGNDPPDRFLAVKIASLPSNGVLKLNNEDVQQGQAISVTDIAQNLFKFLPGADENGDAYATWDFQVQDDGGYNAEDQDTSGIYHMTVNVTPVNDAPSFEADDPPNVDMSADQIDVPNWVTSFNPGGGTDELSQTVVEYVVSNVSNPNLFSALPTVSPDGTLSYTLAPYTNGDSTFEVQVRDSGGIAAGGNNLGQPLLRTVRVRAVVAPFTVNTLEDTADANPGDGRARDASGNTSLRAAIMEANAGPQFANPYTINFSVSGTINVGATLGALPDLANNMNINGPGASQLTIARAANAPNFRIFTTRWIGGSINNLSITNGNAVGNDAAAWGGGIANFGTLSLTNVTMFGNRANDAGGAIANTAGAGVSLTMVGCYLYDNRATNVGGGIYNEGQANIRNATWINYNNAGSGGGIYNQGSGQVTLESGCQVNYNNATGTGTALFPGRGGGIASFGTLTISDTNIWGNTSVNEGGGIFTSGTTTLTGVDIWGNQATDNTNGKGGGIYVRNGTTTLVSGCVVSYNFAAVPLIDPNLNSGIIWADPDGTLIQNVASNQIDDGVDFDSNPR